MSFFSQTHYQRGEATTGAIGENKYVAALIAFVVSFALFLAPFLAFAGMVPSGLRPLFAYPLPAALILAVLTTGTGLVMRRAAAESRNWAIGLAIVGALGITVLAVFAALIIDEDQFADRASFEALRTSFEEMNLSEAQIAQLDVILSGRGYVTATDLTGLSLTDVQRQEVATLLNESGFVTEQDVIAIIEAQEAKRLAETCFITPLAEYSSVSIRQSPEVADDNFIRGLYRGEQIEVIGHNGGTIGSSRWWLVQYGPEDSPLFGWVSSSVVGEVNAAVCGALTQYPT
jgi:hypothetical protein